MQEDKIICYLKAILKELKVLTDKVVSRTNTHVLLSFDTSVTTEKLFDIFKEFGIKKANDLTIIDLGGGFTIQINGNTPTIGATYDLTFEDEDIYSVQVTGSGSTGTGKIRLGAYIRQV